MFRLAKLSLGNRALIALITVFASVFGVITMTSLKQELIPSIEFPQITVITSMPGASPEVVDKQVSGPLETALNGVEGLESTIVDVAQRRLADHPGLHLRLQPGPRPEPDRPRHLQREAGAAEGRPAAGDRRQHQRLPDRLPRGLLGQAVERTQRGPGPPERAPAAEARRRARRRGDRRGHPAHQDPAAARGHGGLRRHHRVHYPRR